MNHQHPKSSIRSPRGFASRNSFVAVLAVLLGYLMIGNSTAVADTCGHYLFRNGKPINEHHGEMRPTELGEQTLPAGESQPNPFSPCNGPGCRKNSNPLLPVPTSASLTQSHDPAVLLEEILSVTSGGETASVPDSERGAVYQAMVIFRPPCA